MSKTKDLHYASCLLLDALHQGFSCASLSGCCLPPPHLPCPKVKGCEFARRSGAGSGPHRAHARLGAAGPLRAGRNAQQGVGTGLRLRAGSVAPLLREPRDCNFRGRLPPVRAARERTRECRRAAGRGLLAPVGPRCRWGAGKPPRPASRTALGGRRAGRSSASWTLPGRHALVPLTVGLAESSVGAAAPSTACLARPEPCGPSAGPRSPSAAGRCTCFPEPCARRPPSSPFRAAREANRAGETHPSRARDP
jgi:hypothetical protein